MNLKSVVYETITTRTLWQYDPYNEKKKEKKHWLSKNFTSHQIIKLFNHTTDKNKRHNLKIETV